MPKLPKARRYQYNDLEDSVPYSTGIGRFGEVTEACFAFTLILLFSLDFVHFRVQVAQF